MDATERDQQPARILLTDDDPALGGCLTRVLRTHGCFDVTHQLDSIGALRCIQAEQWDLLITDIEMPGMTGLGAPELVAKATELIAAGRAARAAGRETVLAIGAHPDDVEIGAAGTLLAHKAAGHTVAILTLSCGAPGGDQAQRARESQEAADVIGARLFLDDLQDTLIAAGNPTIGVIDRVIAEVQPSIVYTHSVHDVHQDHRNTHRAVLVAARRVGRVYCFQSPSATVDYRPTHFVTIDDHIGGKLKAIDAFSSLAGVRDYLEPELITATARYWSRYCGGSHAEPFEVIRNRAGGLPARSAGSHSLVTP
jgi:LmbE family N-acetylglucosaminyl deacetylase